MEHIKQALEFARELDLLYKETSPTHKSNVLVFDCPVDLDRFVLQPEGIKNVKIILFATQVNAKDLRAYPPTGVFGKSLGKVDREAIKQSLKDSKMLTRTNLV